MSAALPAFSVSAFNDRINAQDLDGLSALMTENHVFIDVAGEEIRGKAACAEAWGRFFAAFPDYRNHFEEMSTAEGFVSVRGHSTCSDPLLEGPTLWRAKVQNGRIAEWRVYEDEPANRLLLGFA
jgi:ketosteroid isomerase-like protein